MNAHTHLQDERPPIDALGVSLEPCFLLLGRRQHLEDVLVFAVDLTSGGQYWFRLGLGHGRAVRMGVLLEVLLHARTGLS